MNDAAQGIQFPAFFDSAPYAMVMVNRRGEIVLVNSQTEILFGLPREKLLGRAAEILIPKRFHARHPDYRDSYFRDPQVRPMGAGRQLYGLRGDGTEFPVEITLSPLQTEAGLLVTGAIRDVTNTQTERVLQEKNDDLERANKAKDSFLASMSHELRTPLNGIIGFAEFLADGKPGAINARQKEYLEDILDSGQHLLHLINDVLDIVKIQAGKLDLYPETFAIEDAIREVCAGMLPIAVDKQIDVEVEVAPGLDAVTLDRPRFKQILYNLLSNALKFSHTGGSVKIRAGLEGADRFRLSVRDNGIGIKPEDIQRLFKEFEQLESGTDRRYGGTGLGLALTRTIVERKGGTITVESEPGKGSIFKVILPLAIREEGR